MQGHQRTVELGGLKTKPLLRNMCRFPFGFQVTRTQMWEASGYPNCPKMSAFLSTNGTCVFLPVELIREWRDCLRVWVNGFRSGFIQLGGKRLISDSDTHTHTHPNEENTNQGLWVSFLVLPQKTAEHIRTPPPPPEKKPKHFGCPGVPPKNCQTNKAATNSKKQIIWRRLS